MKIPGYPRYSITKGGVITGVRGWPLKPGNYSGYDTVGLYEEGSDSPTTLYVHRLMAVTFLGLDPSDSKTQVNHKDMVKTNNALDNLELCSQSENLKAREKILNPLDSNTHKRCRMCNNVFSIAGFAPRKSGGVASYCKPCFAAYVRKRRGLSTLVR